MVPSTNTVARAAAKRDDFLYFIMASILSSMANLLKWLQRGKLRASSRDTPAVRRWLEGVRLRRPLEVRRWADGASPLTYGVLRLPTGSFGLGSLVLLLCLQLGDHAPQVVDLLPRQLLVPQQRMPAKQISDKLKETTGWNMNTTYTVIKKLRPMPPARPPAPL